MSSNFLQPLYSMYCTYNVYNFTLKKKAIVFPAPSRDITKQTLPGRELLNYSLPQGEFG
jgi:hypothetical protein